MNDKQAGDVKRWTPFADDDALGMNRADDGAWVRYDDIKDLLKPQEPGQIIQSSANRVGKTYALALEAKIEKLEAENRRLTSVLDDLLSSISEPSFTDDRMRYEERQVDKGAVERALKALNSGGVK